MPIILLQNLILVLEFGLHVCFTVKKNIVKNKSEGLVLSSDEEDDIKSIEQHRVTH